MINMSRIITPDKFLFLLIIGLEQLFKNVRKKKIRQGYTLSPIILYIEEARKILNEKSRVGIKIQLQKISIPHFTDGIVLLAINKEELKSTLSDPNREL